MKDPTNTLQDLYLIPWKNKNYQNVDIVFDKDSALELKTVNTSYTCNGVKNKIRPITLNVKQLEKDIDKLRKLQNKDIKNKGILFVVFPLPDSVTNSV